MIPLRWKQLQPILLLLFLCSALLSEIQFLPISSAENLQYTGTLHATFVNTPVVPYVNDTVTFDASASKSDDGYIFSYEWGFGDGTNGTGIVVGKVYNEAGNYTVTLTITDNLGEESTASRLITVIPKPIGLAIDLYNQKGGLGPNEPSGDFAPKETMILTAFLTYYGEPVGYKFVAFEVIDPTGGSVLYRSNITNVNGLAQITFTIPIIPHMCLPEIFGRWIAFAVSSVSEQTVSDTLTFEVRGPILDVYTQKPDPYNGRGLDQPSDAFAPQEEVILHAEVHYNCEPIEYKPVGFEIEDPYSVAIDYRTAFTDENGIATTSFRLASNATFGIYTVVATVSVSGQNASDTLTFRVGWIIETISVETVNATGVPQTIFARGEHICFNLTAKNIAFVSKTVTFTIVAYDEQDVPIGRAVLQGLLISPGESEIFVVDVQIPDWAFIGSAMGYANAYTDLPVSGGVPYCPEISSTFLIVP